MNLSELEQHIFACYVAGAAGDLNMVGRFWPYGELVMIIEDKIQFATREFGFKVTSRAKSVATAFLDQMIAGEAFSTKQNDFGGTMHQFQVDNYRRLLKQMRETNPIVLKAQGAGPGFWAEAFAGLISNPGA
jgi:hypothetical protein